MGTLVMELDWIMESSFSFPGGGFGQNILFKRVGLKKVYSAIVPDLFFSQCMVNFDRICREINTSRV